MAELTTATTLDERMAALWRNIADPAVGDGRWIALEHELWSYAARNEPARAHLAAPLPRRVGRRRARPTPTGPTATRRARHRPGRHRRCCSASR